MFRKFFLEMVKSAKYFYQEMKAETTGAAEEPRDGEGKTGAAGRPGRSPEQPGPGTKSAYRMRAINK